ADLAWAADRICRAVLVVEHRDEGMKAKCAQGRRWTIQTPLRTEQGPERGIAKLLLQIALKRHLRQREEFREEPTAESLCLDRKPVHQAAQCKAARGLANILEIAPDVPPLLRPFFGQLGEV